LAHEIVELTDSSSKIVYEPLPVDDPKQRKPDIGLAKSKLAQGTSNRPKNRIEKNHSILQKDPLDNLSHKDFTYYNQQ
jgi:dTDP-glucose 4,6-dehydratase